MDVKLNLGICWALAVAERSNSKIYSEAGYWYKNLKADDTHKICQKLLSCIKLYTPPVIFVCLFFLLQISAICMFYSSLHYNVLV